MCARRRAFVPAAPDANGGQDVGHCIPRPLRPRHGVEEPGPARLPHRKRQRRHPQQAVEALCRPLDAGKEQVRGQDGAHQRHALAPWPLQPRRDQGRQSVAVKRGAHLRVRSAASGRPRVAEQADHPAARRADGRGGPECARGGWACQPGRIHVCAQLVHPRNTAGLALHPVRCPGPASTAPSRHLPLDVRLHCPRQPAARLVGRCIPSAQPNNLRQRLPHGGRRLDRGTGPDHRRGTERRSCDSVQCYSPGPVFESRAKQMRGARARLQLERPRVNRGSRIREMGRCPDYRTAAHPSSRSRTCRRRHKGLSASCDHRRLAHSFHDSGLLPRIPNRKQNHDAANIYDS